MSPAPRVDIVIPTVGRPSLITLLQRLQGSAELYDGDRSADDAKSRDVVGAIVLVDDRKEKRTELIPGGPLPAGALQIRIVSGAAAGPAASRNAGWRSAAAQWIAFLDDDVVPDERWLPDLISDLAAAESGSNAKGSRPAEVCGVSGRVSVPLQAARRPTDWERNVKGLETARWITADMAYRRDALTAVGGFDERFPRAYREDADIALRFVSRGLRIVPGKRHVSHPVRPGGTFVSVRLQAGNQDDVLMSALHGRDWYERAGAPRGRLPQHLVATTAALTACVAFLAGKRRLAKVAAAAWLLTSAQFAWARISPGPRDRREVRAMLLTSALIPFAASWHWLRGWAQLPRLLTRPSHKALPGREAPAAVLFDRDGTLIVDVPDNTDPKRVQLMPGAREALRRLRENGIPVAVVSNQSSVSAGRVSLAQLDAVNARIEELAGPLGPWCLCLHSSDEGCDCRKPAPGLVREAADALGVPTHDCVVVGDVGADVQAALAAGAQAVLVPTPATQADEIALAPLVARDLREAVDIILSGRT
ncbi:MAG: HAD family hydrolase [Candidatus Eremiobacter antarcticus]|nr:HAD-IIIA family hydrolase [Candidatus Eremiobacteraeota bacterium]MBC5807385.1 HAD-IIIA family hydrolase [Candidatus Eremiobacteraeota bacterium]PZR63136.1 MAG: HAD family hydrolase [Candidatus Eremiobacter sp. RRmetagenome_bin22]